MGRYDKYKQLLKQENEFNEEQKRLHEKHDSIDEDKVIVEKSNTFKFTLSFLRGILKALCTIAIFVLAAIGLTTLIYPNVRDEFMVVVISVLNDVRAMVGI